METEIRPLAGQTRIAAGQGHPRLRPLKAVSYLSAGAAERGSEAQKGRQTSRRWVSPSGTPETKHLVTGPFVPRHPGPCVRLELFGYPHTAEASGSLRPGLARGTADPIWTQTGENQAEPAVTDRHLKALRHKANRPFVQVAAVRLPALTRQELLVRAQQRPTSVHARQRRAGRSHGNRSRSLPFSDRLRARSKCL